MFSRSLEAIAWVVRPGDHRPRSERCIASREALTQLDLSNMRGRSSLDHCVGRLGGMYLEQGDLARALALEQRTLATREAVLAAHTAGARRCRLWPT